MKHIRHVTTKVSSIRNIHTNKAIISVAVTGDVADKSRAKAVPLTTQEQIADIEQCYHAGARLVHVHVRDPENQYKGTWKSKLYQEVMEGVKERCPDMIFEASTGNYGPTFAERSEMLLLKPEMASLTPGSVNLRVTRPGEGTYKEYINTHSDIQGLAEMMVQHQIKPEVAIFDLSHIYYAGDLVKRGLLKLPAKIMFVLGGHMALEPKRKVLEFLVDECRETFGEDNFVWSSVGVGWCHEPVQRWTLELGGHPRTGFEDTLMIRRGEYATSNAQLVSYIADLCKEYDRPIANGAEARSILGL